MTSGEAAPASGAEDCQAVPRQVAWAFLGLLVLPFDPFWVDFEQARRALLLLLTGGLLVAYPRLPRVRHEVAWIAFVAFLGVAAVVSFRSLQPWEAAYRLAHFIALLFVLRLGAALRGSLATPLAALLAVTSLFGLLQRLGLAELAGYGRAIEPIAVFGNLNVASEWTAVVLLAVVVLPSSRRALQLAALALAGAYLVVNGSRAGMIAGGIGLLVFVLKRRRVTALTGPGIALGGAGLGLLLALGAAQPMPQDPRQQNALEQRAAKTIEVRLEIARGCTELLEERPLFGWGPGQFQVQYPRVRSQREIEISSHGRRFASEVRTAHDDWIELLVEGGLPVLLLFAAALFALERASRDKERLLPLLVLMLLMFARAPLANAPAVVAALLPAATALSPAQASRERSGTAWLPWLTRGLGLLLLALGLLPLVAHFAFRAYPAAVEAGERPDIRAAMAAHRWMWWEPRWLQVLAQEQLYADNVREAQKAAAMAVKLRPHDPQLLKQLAEALVAGGAFAAAAEVVDAAYGLDPGDPALRMLSCKARLLDRNHDAALDILMDAPPSWLVPELPGYLERMARGCEERGDAVGADRCRAERAFLLTLETIGKPGTAALDATAAHLRELLLAMVGAGTTERDARYYVLKARHHLDLDETYEAVKVGVALDQYGLGLRAWQRALIGDGLLAPLREHPVWRKVLQRQP